MTDRILLVDDDPNILSALKRQLRKKFVLDFAEGGAVAIEKIENEGPYAVVVSDMQMPDVDGLQLLKHVREYSPETTRIMLTGNADQRTAIDAVNEGQIFRFINKPCSSEDLSAVLTSALEHFRLVTAEQELLAQTLNGSIDRMTDILAMVNPTAFGRANRVREIVKSMSGQLGLNDSWQLEIAAALSQIGSVTIPASILEKSYAGESLPEEDQKIIDEHPLIASRLVSRIPRLQSVGQIIELATKGDAQKDPEIDETVEIASNLLNLVLTYDSFAIQQKSPSDALKATSKLPQFAKRTDWIKALSSAVAEDCEIKQVRIADLRIGMILDEDLRTNSGVLLVTRGQQFSESSIARLHHYRARGHIANLVNVRCPK